MDTYKTCNHFLSGCTEIVALSFLAPTVMFKDQQLQHVCGVFGLARWSVSKFEHSKSAA